MVQLRHGNQIIIRLQEKLTSGFKLHALEICLKLLLVVTLPHTSVDRVPSLVHLLNLYSIPARAHTYFFVRKNQEENRTSHWHLANNALGNVTKCRAMIVPTGIYFTFINVHYLNFHHFRLRQLP